ncbi:ATP-binding protein [Staphylococcus epidermidis]|uniref:ATP-binding protein n=1 Tax=Staphylococcus epidermidis TaxID=1282 RepID=UPI001F417C9F|nr:ATP-binding protein [Staphylococcus epidermidis]MCH9557244.1 ATP-binding protein [Staphylococcus epidermidis]MCO6201097.1 ATP-binding protein [Staphylococcus epidermidis]
MYAFEESETSLHPNHQLMLIESFLSLSSNSNNINYPYAKFSIYATIRKFDI